MDGPEEHPTAWPCEVCMPITPTDAVSWLPLASAHYRIVWLQWAREFVGLKPGSAAIGRSFGIQQAARDLRLKIRTLKCPVCGQLARHSQDIEQGYCGHCHWWTFDPVMVGGWLEDMAEKVRLAPEIDALRPSRAPLVRREIELWAFCDDDGCQEVHEPDEFGNQRHKLPDDHPLVRQLNNGPATIDPGA